MSLYFTNEWYIFNGELDKTTRNKIKNLGKGKWEEASVDTAKGITDEERISGKKGDYKTDKKTRISHVFWTNDQWIYDLTWPYMMEANQRTGWNLVIKAAESMQLTRYKKGGF